MKRMITVVAALAFLAAAAPAQTNTADMTVFGFRLGEKLSLPECAHLKKSTLYLGNDSSPCFERLLLPSDKAKWSAPVADETVQIRFPFGRQPSLISGLEIVGQVIAGNLEGLGFNTSGLSAQDRTLAALKDKYGEPAKLLTETKVNALGARFDSMVATWGFENLTVVFQGTTDRIDSGLVNIDTGKASDFRAAILRNSQKGPKL